MLYIQTMMDWGYCCFFCQLPLAIKAHGICSHCLHHLPALPPCCLRCGLPSDSKRHISSEQTLFLQQSTADCPHCQAIEPKWQQLIAVSDYLPPLSDYLQQYKLKGHFEQSQLFARLILLKWLTYRRTTGLTRPDYLVPVPLHHQRQQQRGFNQTSLIAKQLAHWLSVPFRPNILKKSAHHQDQKNLSAQERQLNVAHIFSCEQDVTGQHIALLDDIVTTGSTANAICQTLLDRGAASIQLLCVCRTL